MDTPVEVSRLDCLLPALRLIKGTIGKGKRKGEDYSMLVVDKSTMFNSFICLQADKAGVQVIDLRDKEKE